MKTLSFLDSEFYGLAEVHALNMFLKELPTTNMSKEMIDYVGSLLSCYKSFDKLEDYVPGSDKYNQIHLKNVAYKEAQEKLKELNYTNETILDDSRAGLSNLTKHSITYKTVHTYSDWSYDYEMGDEVADTWEEEVEVTEHFYTKSYTDYTAIDPTDYIKSYIRSDRYDTVDLIAVQLKSYDRVCSELRAYKFCVEKGYNVNTFMKVFDVNNLAYYGLIDISEVEDERSGKRYRLWDIEKLMQEVEVAKQKRYIHEDKYVKYPHTDYVNFLENYLGKTYFEEANSQ
jgi:hypothetical protein